MGSPWKNKYPRKTLPLHTLYPLAPELWIPTHIGYPPLVQHFKETSKAINYEVGPSNAPILANILTI
jgi:hypothetical protein